MTMDKDLADILQELSTEKRTGVLSISIRGDNNLLKFFFRDGAIYHVTYSACRNVECLIRLRALAVDKGAFMQGARVDAGHAITIATNDIIEQVRKLEKTIPWGLGAGAPAAAAAESLMNHADLQRLEEELLSMVGPAGSIIFEQASGALGVSRNTPIRKRLFHDLVHAIARQIPEEHRTLLLSKFAF